MNIEVMDKELRSWVTSMLAYFNPEKCRRCKKLMRVPIHEVMRDLGWLYCPVCKEFSKRTK